MARREVLVQLEDRLVQDLDRIASERGVSRSEVLRRLALALIEAEDEYRADAEAVAAYTATPPDETELAWLAQTAAENAIEW